MVKIAKVLLKKTFQKFLRKFFTVKLSFTLGTRKFLSVLDKKVSLYYYYNFTVSFALHPQLARTA